MTRVFCPFCGAPSVGPIAPHGDRPCPEKLQENELRRKLLEAQIRAVEAGETTRVPWPVRDPYDP